MGCDEPLRKSELRVLAEIAAPSDRLIANNEIQANAANLDEITVIQAGQTADSDAVDHGHFVAGADVMAVVTLIDLSGHLWLEPAAKLDGSHSRLADGGELVGEDVFLGVSLASENDDGRNLDASGGKLSALAHSGCLLQHVATNLGIKHHGFVDHGSCGFLAAGIVGNRGIAGSIDLDVMLA